MSTPPDSRLRSFEERIEQVPIDAQADIDALPPGSDPGEKRSIIMRAMATLANFLARANEAADGEPSLAEPLRRIDHRVRVITEELRRRMP